MSRWSYRRYDASFFLAREAARAASSPGIDRAAGFDRLIRTGVSHAESSFTCETTIWSIASWSSVADVFFFGISKWPKLVTVAIPRVAPVLLEFVALEITFKLSRREPIPVDQALFYPYARPQRAGSGVPGSDGAPPSESNPKPGSGPYERPCPRHVLAPDLQHSPDQPARNGMVTAWCAGRSISTKRRIES